MKKMLVAAVVAAFLVPAIASAGQVTKGSVQRLDLDSITLDGTIVTSTGSELNILDGVTATAAELNYNDIATLGTGAASKAVVLDASGDYTYPATGTVVYPASSSLSLAASSTFSLFGTSVTATGAELNYLDISSLGTGAASKAVVLDSGDDYTWPATGVLTYGVLNDGTTALGSSAAELNKLDVSAGDCGTAVDLSGSNVTTTIERAGNLCIARFVLAATPVSVTDAAGSGSYGTLKFVDLSEGYVASHSCSEVYEVLADDGTLAQNNLAGDIGVGSVSLAAAQDGALANATDDDICDETVFDINASAGPYTEITHPVAVIDGSATAADIALNVSGSADTADANGTLTVTGQYTIVYSMEGDD